MKLRVRSTATKETLRIEAPDPCSLAHLKALIAAKLSPSVAPESIRLSLNRKDELLPASPDDDSLRALGLTSGDLLFFSFCSHPDALTLTPTATGSLNPPPVPAPDGPSGMDVEAMARESTLSAISPRKQAGAAVDMKREVGGVRTREGPDSLVVMESPESSNLAQVQPSDVTFEEADAEKSTGGHTDDQREDAMEVGQELVVAKRFSVPGFLKRVMEVENVRSDNLLRCLVMIIHAALLESGFVVSGDGGYRLPEGSLDASGVLSFQYSVPQLVGLDTTRNVKNAVLKFSTMGTYATVYAYLSGGQSDVYRVCFSLLDTALVLVLEIGTLNEFEEKKVFALWKMVKDKLALPLLIDICCCNGLPSPPCFMLLPTDMKLKILACVPGVDIAALACTCSELRYLSSNDELWKQKFEDEFGLLNERGLTGRNWRDKYVNCWVKAKNAKRMRVERERVRIRPNPHSVVQSSSFRQPHRFPVIGGDYDWSPGGGGFPPTGPRLGFPRFSSGRRFSPDCHLGDRDADYIE